MFFRRSENHAASHNEPASWTDQLTLHAFMFTVTLTTAVVLSYGPAAALHHIADVLMNMPSLPVPDDAAWGAQFLF